MFTTPIRILFRRHDILAGICLIIVSYLPFKFPDIRFNNLTSLLIGLSFPLGVLLIANQIVLRMGGFSPIRLIRGSRVNNHSFTVVCVVFGAILEFVAADLGGLWYFPYWSVSTYLLIGFLLGGWTFYFLFLIVCYEAVKLVLDKFLPQKKRVVSYFHNEAILYKSLFVVGIGLLAIVIRQALVNTHYFTQFHYEVDQIKPPYITWQYWIMTFFGLWFICEYVEFKKKRSSLLKDIFHGYFNPLLAILAVSLILALSYELQNQRVWLWRYANYPLANHEILNIPLFVILTWPLHIIGAAVFWRAFGNSSSSFVFANSKQKSKSRPSKPKLRRLVPAAGATRR